MKTETTLTAQKLIHEIRELCFQHGIPPAELAINYRHDSDSDVYPIAHTGNGLWDGNVWLRPSFDGKSRSLSAQELIDRVKQTCRAYKTRLDEVGVCVRFGSSGEASTFPITEVWEDLYDETNSVLESLLLVTSAD